MLPTLLAAAALLNPVSVILTDIEGTTSSISFVHETLFPYAKEHLRAYLLTHEREPAVAALLSEVQTIAQVPAIQVPETLLSWMAQDKKIGPLKSLQGMIWEEGYNQGAFQGHLYEDAYQQLSLWKQLGYELCIYSSGSVQAQKLLFSHSPYGDLTPLFSHYFDTQVGGKKEASSYRQIATQIGVPPECILFLSDSLDELNAARSAGMQTICLNRDNAPLVTTHPVVASFSDIPLSLKPDLAAREIVAVGHFLHNLGLCPASSGNFSLRISPFRIAITASGKHKGELTPDDILLVDLQGTPLTPHQKPSAETALHTLIYRRYPQVGAILHTHSVNGTVLSRLLAPATAFTTHGYEIHKAFAGIKTHESTLTLPIFENSQDYTRLSREIDAYLDTHPQPHGFYLRGHGLYTWGTDLKAAKHQAEGYEFLFECELKERLCR